MSTSSSPTAPEYASPRFASAHSVVSPSDQREATTRVSSLWAASGVHSPVASRSP
jgi:hypothetical protein